MTGNILLSPTSTAPKRGGARLRNAVCLVVFCVLCCASLCAQQVDMQDTVKNPFAGDGAAAQAGKALYEQTCSACHGGDAQGGRGPSLATGQFTHGGEDIDLFSTIRDGIPGSQMPSFSALPRMMSGESSPIFALWMQTEAGAASRWRVIPSQGRLFSGAKPVVASATK